MPATVGVAVVLGVCLVVALSAQRRRGREEAAAEPTLAEGEQARPLTFREDLARARSGLPPPRGPDGKPVMQPWTVGPLMYVAFACSVLSLIPLVGLGLGLAGFLFCNTAWGAPAQRGTTADAGAGRQILGAMGFAIGILSFVVVLSQT